jgi:hypothetical protein
LNYILAKPTPTAESNEKISETITNAISSTAIKSVNDILAKSIPSDESKTQIIPINIPEKIQKNIDKFRSTENKFN